MYKNRFTPDRIYNVDETGITTVPNKPSRVKSKLVLLLQVKESTTAILASHCTYNFGAEYS